MKQEFISPVGRLVQGNPFELSDKGYNGAIREKPQCFIGVAFRKDDPKWPSFYQSLVTAARAGFPQMFDAAGTCTARNFAWKVVDGDGYDDAGKPHSAKEGFAGHWVVRFTSGYAPKCYRAGHYLPHEQLQDPKSIPRGYYVRVAGSAVANGDLAKPGIYLNLGMVELVQAGEVIQSGPDAATVFAAPIALPPGVAPVGPTPASAAVPAPTQPAAAPPPYPAILAAAAPPPAPITGRKYLSLGEAASARDAASAPPAPTGPVMTPKAGGASYESFVALGWNDAQLREQGYLV